MGRDFTTGQVLADGKDHMMNLKWIGAALVILSCGGTGFAMAAAHKLQESQLRQLMNALDYMQCELQYRMSPLPDLCRQTAVQSGGVVSQLFLDLAAELEDQIAPDVQSCMNAVTAKLPGLPATLSGPIQTLGKTLGRFDINGQIRGLESTRQECRRALETLLNRREERLRGYQTLGLCAGAAVAILFL